MLEISEADFLILKNEQSLLVDFQAFPNKLIDLIELCYSNFSSENRVAFICTLDIRSNGEAIFSVVETNNFKALTHLQLKFKTATDESMKLYLASKLQLEKQSNEDLRISNRKLSEELNGKSMEHESLFQEYKLLQEEMHRVQEQTKLDEQIKFNDFAEKSMERESRMISEWEIQKRESENDYKSRISQLESKLSKYTASNESLTESKYELESLIKEQNSRIKIFERESEASVTEINELRSTNKENESKNYNYERKVSELNFKIQSLEQQLQDKSSLNEKDTSLLEEAKSRCQALQTQLDTQSLRSEKLERKISKLSSEIEKGNEIISKLQEDIEKKRKKLKLKDSIVLSQEKTVVQQSETLDKASRELNEAKRQNDIKDISIKEQESTLTMLKGKLSESQKLIESNNSSFIFSLSSDSVSEQMH